jgi:hypothetical protein
MFRSSRIPTRGHGAVARQLGRFPSGTRVQLHYGSVFVRYVRQWMVAGVIGDPVTSTEPSRLNGGVMPQALSPAWEPGEVTP